MREQYGLNAAVLLMQLVSEYNYYKDKETLTPDGYFYSTVEHLENETCLSGHEQRKAINILTDLSVLKVVSKGIPAKRHFKINFEGIARLFDKIAKERTAQKARNSQLLKNLISSNEKSEPQADENFNTNNKIYIDGLKEYVINARLTKSEREALEQEFQRLEIALTDDYIEILSQSAYKRLLFMRAGVTSIFCTPHRYKLRYLNAKKLIALYDKFAEFAEKTDISEPVPYFKKMLLEYLNEKVTV